MTHLETARYNEVIGLQIAAVREIAAKLEPDLPLERLETEIAALEAALAELKADIAAVPHRKP